MKMADKTATPLLQTRRTIMQSAIETRQTNSVTPGQVHTAKLTVGCSLVRWSSDRLYIKPKVMSETSPSNLTRNSLCLAHMNTYTIS